MSNLVLDIETDGSIHPESALKGAANILIQHFMLFSDQTMILEICGTKRNRMRWMKKCCT